MTAETLQGFDPRTGDPYGEPVPPTAPEEVDRLVAASVAAFDWLEQQDLATRGRLLRVLAGALRDAADELVPVAESETALPTARLTGELARTVAQLELMADAVESGDLLDVTIDEPNAEAVPPHGDLRRLLVPLGPVAVFAASNFPFAFSVPGGDTASALAAGCSVVVKAHPSHPGLSVLTARVLRDALAAEGAPEGLLSVVAGNDAGVALVQHPSIKAVGFTGSTHGGRALMEMAAARPEPIPFYGELGSINPVVVTEAAAAARGEEVATGLVGSYLLGSGQFCTKPGIVLVPAGSGLEERIVEAASGAPAPAPLLNERIAASYRSGVEALGSIEGVDVLLQPRGVELRGFAVEAGLVGASVDTFLEHQHVLAEECFGPVTVLVRWRTQEELTRVLDALPGALTGTVQGAVEAEAGDPTASLALAHLQRRCGRVLYNGWPTGVAVTWSQTHGGPWPSTTSALHTSVGVTAVRRFQRPVTFQDTPDSLLPAALRRDNPWGISRRLNGRVTLK